MERFEALRMIRESLDGAIKYLEELDAGLRPRFMAEGINFNVGVDIVGTANREKVDYEVSAYRGQPKLSPGDVSSIVLKVEPDFDGRITTSRGLHASYPASSFLNLNFLKDFKKSL